MAASEDLETSVCERDSNQMGRLDIYPSQSSSLYGAHFHRYEILAETAYILGNDLREGFK